MSDLSKADMDFLSYFAKEADSSRWNEVIVKTPIHSLTKQHIFDYYSTPSIRHAILKQLREGPAIVHQNFSHEEPVLKRWEKGEPVHIQHDGGEVEDPKDYNYWIERRATEFHPTIGKTTKKIWVDLDPHPTYDWKKTKEMAGKVSDLLYKHPDVHDIELRFSGGTGFHVVGELGKEMPTPEAKKLVEEIILPLAHDRSITTSMPARKGQIRLDTSTLHEGGSLRGLYSLNKHTGLACVPVEPEHLHTFEAEHATINSVLGGNPRRAKPLRS
jgi:hypothetical protein